MEVLIENIKGLSEKAEYLNRKTQALVEENRFLKEKLLSLSSTLDQKERELDEVGKDYNTLKLARKIGESGGSSEETLALKKRIDQYIKEIDSCLKMIGG